MEELHTCKELKEFIGDSLSTKFTVINTEKLWYLIIQEFAREMTVKMGEASVVGEEMLNYDFCREETYLAG
jgi:hypothetical protein